MSKVVATSKTFDGLRLLVNQYPQTITYYDKAGHQFILAEESATEDDFKALNIEIMTKAELVGILASHGVHM